LIETEKLDIILQKCRIIREYLPLPETMLGYYYSDEHYYFIMLNENIRSDERLDRCVLAEEIGHYHTSIGNITPRKHMCYRDRLTKDRQELQAIKWAIDFLIPTRLLLDVIVENKAVSLQELADYFMVTQDFLMQKLEFMSKKNGIWDLDGKTALYLYNFPSVYIYEKI
jgi:Zn-dependent peptidase ImmA (M78 family)